MATSIKMSAAACVASIPSAVSSGTHSAMCSCCGHISFGSSQVQRLPRMLTEPAGGAHGSCVYGPGSIFDRTAFRSLSLIMASSMVGVEKFGHAHFLRGVRRARPDSFTTFPLSTVGSCVPQDGQNLHHSITCVLHFRHGSTRQSSSTFWPHTTATVDGSTVEFSGSREGRLYSRFRHATTSWSGQSVQRSSIRSFWTLKFGVCASLSHGPSPHVGRTFRNVSRRPSWWRRREPWLARPHSAR